MTVAQIVEKANIKYDLAESLYYHSIKLRLAKPTDNIKWNRVLNDKRYREDFNVEW